MNIRITCVYDEGAIEGTSLIGAKGTSMLVDINGIKVLFDTGLRSRYLIHNLCLLDIDPNSIDIVVISQTCPDNCNALDGLLEARNHAVEVYCPADTYSISRTPFGRRSTILQHNCWKAKLNIIKCWMDIAPGVAITPMLGPSDGYKEAFLVIGDGESYIILSGRGSYGPGDILNTVSNRYGKKVTTFIGSLLLEKAGKSVAKKYLDILFDYGCTDLYLNHCTGRDGIMNLRIISGLNGINDFYVGSVYCKSTNLD